MRILLLVALAATTAAFTDAADGGHAYELCQLGGGAEVDCGAMRECAAVDALTGGASARLCVHKGLTPVAWRDAGVAAVLFAGAVLAAMAGGGGGGFFVPALVLMGGFLQQEARPMMHAVVFGCTLVQTVLNVRFARGGGGTDIDYATALLLLPQTLAAHAVGSVLDRMLPANLVRVFALALLAFVAYRMWRVTRNPTWAGGVGSIDMAAFGDCERKESLLPAEATTEMQSANPLGRRASVEDDPLWGFFPTPTPPTTALTTTTTTAKATTDANVQPPKSEAAADSGEGSLVAPPSDDGADAPAGSARACIAMMGVWWAVYIGLRAGLNQLETCSAGYWAMLVAFPLAAAAFILLMIRCRVDRVLRHHEGDLPRRRVLQGLAAALGLSTGLLGLGGGELLVTLLLEFGVAPQVAAATAAYCLTVMSSAELVQHFIMWDWFFVDGWYMAVGGVVVALGAAVGRVASVRLQRRRGYGAVVPAAMCVFLAALIGLTAGSVASQADQDGTWWPPVSGCDYEAHPRAFKVHTEAATLSAAAAQLGDGLGFGEVALAPGLAGAPGEGGGSGSVSFNDNGEAEVNVGPAGFTGTAEVLGESRKVEMAQVPNGTSVVRVSLGGDFGAALAEATERSANGSPQSGGVGGDAPTPPPPGGATECIDAGDIIRAFPDARRGELRFCPAALLASVAPSGAVEAVQVTGLMDMDTAPLRRAAAFLRFPVEERLAMEAAVPFAPGTSLSGYQVDASAAPLVFTAITPGVTSLGSGFAVGDATLHATVTQAGGALDVDFGINATGTLRVGGSDVPISLAVREEGGALRMTGWADAVELRLAGLSVQGVSLEMDGVVNIAGVAGGRGASALAAASPTASLSIASEVTTERGASVRLAGTVLPGSADFAMAGAVEGASLDDMLDLVERVAGVRVAAPAALADMEVQSLVLGYATQAMAAGGIEVQAGATLQASVAVAGWRCALSGRLTDDGVELVGAVSQSDMDALGPFSDKVEAATLRASLKVSRASGAVRFAIQAAATLYGVDLAMEFSYVKEGPGAAAKLVWASASAAGGGDLSLATVFPALEGTVAEEIAFGQVAFLYSSEALGGVPGLAGFENKPVGAGLTLHARVSRFDPFAALFDFPAEDFPGVDLTATIDPDLTKARIEMGLPPGASVSLGRSCEATGARVVFHLSAAPPGPRMELVFSSACTPPSQETALHFDTGLVLSPLGASVYGAMHGYWEAPFGVSGLRIGPELGLEIGIIYAQLAATGTPSSVGIRGGLQLGSIGGDVGLKVSTNPAENVLMGALSTNPAGRAITPNEILDTFANVTRLSLPAADVPDFFEVYDLELFVAPAAGQLAGTSYGAGLSFTANLTLFGTAAAARCEVGEGRFMFDGSIEPLSIGPLAMHGATGADAPLVLQMAISAEEQRMLLDATVTLFGMEVAAYVRVDGVNDVEFNATMDFGAAFTFAVAGVKNGSAFYLHAEMESDVLGWVGGQIKEALVEVEAGFETAAASLAEKEAAYRAEFDAAQADLDAAAAAAAAKREELVAAVAAQNAAFFNDVAEKRAEMEARAAEFGELSQQAQQALLDATQAFNAALQGASSDLARKREAFAAAFDAAQARVDDAEAAVRQAFDDAEADVERTKSAYERAKANRVHWQGVSCGWNLVCQGERGAKITYYGTQEGVLLSAYHAAKAFLDAGEFLAADAALGAARGSLEAVENGPLKAAVDAAEAALEAVMRGNEAAAKAVAQADFDAIGTVLEKYGPYGIAASALAVAESEGQALVDAALQAFNSFAETAEAVAHVVATAALEAVEESTVAVSFKAAQLAVDASAQLVAAIRENLNLEGLFAVHHFELTAVMASGASLEYFNVALDAELFGQAVEFELTLNPRNAADAFVSALREAAIDKAEELAASIISR